MSHDMWFPTMWHFDKCRLRQACTASFQLRSFKLCSDSSLTLLEYLGDKQRLWSDCAYAQADLRLCWLHIPDCWKSHRAAHISCEYLSFHEAQFSYFSKSLKHAFCLTNFDNHFLVIWPSVGSRGIFFQSQVSKPYSFFVNTFFRWLNLGQKLNMFF